MEFITQDLIEGDSIAKIDFARVLNLGKQTLIIESECLLKIGEGLDHAFSLAIETIFSSTGRVIVMGIGKSGHIGRKIAATLASTGTPAFFVHPAEAAHGDLGMITSVDVVLAISNSGEATELTDLLPSVRQIGSKLISITSRPDSTLGRASCVVIDNSVHREACPLNLAPTSSTTAQLAIGDAMAIALLDARGFSALDFARSHPGGELGRRLLTRVADIMRTQNELPLVQKNASVLDAVEEMSRKRLDIAIVVDEQKRLFGVFSIGDLRHCIEGDTNIKVVSVSKVIKCLPPIIKKDILATEVVKIMRDSCTSVVLVADEIDDFIGAVTAQDLISSRIWN